MTVAVVDGEDAAIQSPKTKLAPLAEIDAEVDKIGK